MSANYWEKRALSRHVLGKDRFMPARSPIPLPKKENAKTKNISPEFGKKGPSLGTYLVKTVSCLL